MSDESGLRYVQAIESWEINVASIQDIDGSWLYNEFIKDVYLESVQLYITFRSSEKGPWKNRQA